VEEALILMRQTENGNATDVPLSQGTTVLQKAVQLRAHFPTVIELERVELCTGLALKAPPAPRGGGFQFKSGCPDHLESITYGRRRCPTLKRATVNVLSELTG
jgi:hypothetical protein